VRITRDNGKGDIKEYEQHVEDQQIRRMNARGDELLPSHTSLWHQVGNKQSFQAHLTPPLSPDEETPLVARERGLNLNKQSAYCEPPANTSMTTSIGRLSRSPLDNLVFDTSPQIILEYMFIAQNTRYTDFGLQNYMLLS